MGVKSLWSLLEPVGRPVLLETMEGKAMAIDSSIWLYQFQAAMRDKEGRGLANAHVVGFLRRICKLLFYGIKPVFVFDGGAPTLKRATIAERKNKKAGAAASHAKVAERLLAAQMRREALNQIQAQSASKGKGKALHSTEETVYLEDLDPNAPKTPARPPRSTAAQDTPPSSGKKRWRDHDPYRLPDIDMEAKISQVTSSHLPDPRLATEDELQAFIDEMKPEDFDVNSPAFRELPTEVQYEIIGDLRLKSRQTSYTRLQNMLRKAKTPMDFSKEQINNLKQRNKLTQQLLITTDSIGKAHVEIPIRIASERNKQYVLVKNEGEIGGWILGVRDEGTRAKPIEVDRDHPSSDGPMMVEGENEESDMDMEEVEITASTHDPDLREHRRSVALSALAERYSPQKSSPLSKQLEPKPPAKPLFAPEDDEIYSILVPEETDPDLLAAMQQSLADAEELDMQRAIEASKNSAHASSRIGQSSSSRLEPSSSHSAVSHGATTSPRKVSQSTTAAITTRRRRDSGSDDDLYASPTRLETALSIANAGPSRIRQVSNSTRPQGMIFGVPALLALPTQSPKDSPKPLSSRPRPQSEDGEERARDHPFVNQEGLEDLEVMGVQQVPQSPIILDSEGEDDDMEEVTFISETRTRVAESSKQPTFIDDEVILISSSSPDRPSSTRQLESNLRHLLPSVQTPTPKMGANVRSSLASTTSDRTLIPETLLSVSKPHDDDTLPSLKPTFNNADSDIDSDEHSTRWSRSPSPTLLSADVTIAEDSNMPTTRPDKANTETAWDDATHRIDIQAEESGYAQFISQVRGKDLRAAKREIDEEIRGLREQKKVAMRDSEDITQQMISQIMLMLRLFGIPYITAPMEAEAQCATLLSLSLVDGIITDDSDVFLFGGTHVFKNMFNQSKTVECFLATDLERELGLRRSKLVGLAHLLGSDYTEGLQGVGPVVAMELLAEFGDVGEGGGEVGEDDPLVRFGEWWRRVQSGKDTAKESSSKFRKRFKKRFKDLFLPEEWPNFAVSDAYYHPTVDDSDEPFKWGLPDLDGLREFFHGELGWDQAKVDDMLLPIIQKMNKRMQEGALNKQGTLLNYFDAPIAMGAPKKRHDYASKRLQDVISKYRMEQKQKKQTSNRAGSLGTLTPDSNAEGEGAGGDGSGDESDDEIQEVERPKKRKKATENGEDDGRSGRGGAIGRSRGRGRGGRGRGRGRGGGRSVSTQPPSNKPKPRKSVTKKKKAISEDLISSESDANDVGSDFELQGGTGAADPPGSVVNLRPRPQPRPIFKQTKTREGSEDEIVEL